MISELLKDAGYRVYTVGKWHLGGSGHGGEPPGEWGFDRSYGIYTGGANHWNQGAFRHSGDSLLYLHSFRWLSPTKNKASI